MEMHTDDGRPIPTTDEGADPGLAALRQATAAYTRLRDTLGAERQRAARLERELAEARRERTELARREVEALGRLADARRQLAVESERATQLAAAVGQVHRGLYSGSTSAMLLDASLQITTATRGYYVSMPDLRIRAASGVPARIGEPASPFVAAICQRVIERGDALQWNSEHGPDGVDPSPDEQFREGVAVIVAVRGAPAGVIVALDKAVGEFQPDDVRSLVSIGGEAGIAVENAELRDEIQRAYLSTVTMLADTIEAADPYTHGHCTQVALYAREAARRLGLDDALTRVTCYAALLHDIGKIGVSDGVLNKPGPLLEEERTLMQAHVRIGHDLLRNVPALGDVAPAVLHHHEWWNGTGYPKGLRGGEIPMPSRIVAVVDAYCAMLDRRSYKAPVTPEQAKAELRRCAGTQFDPDVVDAALAAIDAVDTTPELREPGCGLLPGLTCPDVSAAARR